MKFASHIEYAADAERIAALRPDHRAYLAELFEQGALVAAGPFTDDSGALFVYEADSLEEALRLVAADPFAIGGVFTRVVTKPWKPVFVNAKALEQS